MYKSDDEQSRREFYYHESNNTKKNNVENDDSMSRYTYVMYVVNLDLLVITGNIRPRSIMYGTRPTGLVRTVRYRQKPHMTKTPPTKSPPTTSPTTIFPATKTPNYGIQTKTPHFNPE